MTEGQQLFVPMVFQGACPKPSRFAQLRRALQDLANALNLTPDHAVMFDAGADVGFEDGADWDARELEYCVGLLDGFATPAVRQLAIAVKQLRGARPDPAKPKTQLARTARRTSVRAALLALPHSGTQRWRILEALKRHGGVEAGVCPTAPPIGGLTDEELATDLDMNPNTVRPRRGELVSGGHVRASGFFRKTVGGADAVVWVVIVNGRQAE